MKSRLLTYRKEGILNLEIKTPRSEGKAGNGIRTRDILLGNFPINSDPAPEVEK